MSSDEGPMMSFTIRCQCGETLEVPEDAVGRQGQCPKCGRTFTIPGRMGAPASAPTPPQTAGPTGAQPPVSPVPGPSGAAPPTAGLVRCWRCGATNQAGAVVCASCGAGLVPVAAPQRPTEDAALGGLIPYKNVPALVGYYLAVFALIPCVGIPLGIAAVVLGAIGLSRAKNHPEARGKVHAWFAIIFGAVCAVGHVVLIVMTPRILDALD